MNVIDRGYISILQPDKFSLKDKDDAGRFLNERWYDARVHHSNGYKPERLLVWRDEIESITGNPSNF